MAYANNKRNDGNNKHGGSKFNNNFNKPIMKALPLVVTGYDNKGKEYNADSAIAIIQDLQDCGVFTKLSVDVTMAKTICLDNPEAKGVMSIARLQSFDADTMEMTVMLFGKNTSFADKITNNMVIVPRVRTGRDSNDVVTILGFEIVEE